MPDGKCLVPTEPSNPQWKSEALTYLQGMGFTAHHRPMNLYDGCDAALHADGLIVNPATCEMRGSFRHFTHQAYLPEAWRDDREMVRLGDWIQLESPDADTHDAINGVKYWDLVGSTFDSDDAAAEAIAKAARCMVKANPGLVAKPVYVKFSVQPPDENRVKAWHGFKSHGVKTTFEQVEEAVRAKLNSKEG